MKIDEHNYLFGVLQLLYLQHVYEYENPPVPVPLDGVHGELIGTPK